MMLAAIKEAQNEILLHMVSEIEQLEDEEWLRKELRRERRAGTGIRLDLESLGDDIWKEQFRCVIVYCISSISMHLTFHS
jgi:hypothetical protein